MRQTWGTTCYSAFWVLAALVVCVPEGRAQVCRYVQGECDRVWHEEADSQFRFSISSELQLPRRVTLNWSAGAERIAVRNATVRLQSPEIVQDEPLEAGYRIPDWGLENGTGSSGFSDWMPEFQVGEGVQSYWEDSVSDLRNFYSSDNLPLFATFLGVGATMANTTMDQHLLDTLQDNITFYRSDEYREFVGEFKFMGDGYSLLPLYAGSALLGKHLLGDYPVASHVGEWGERSFRAILIGTPPLLLSQRVIGASRPGETGEGSEWQFWADDNGVSGHSFMGAVPFLTAANMAERRTEKFFWITCSTLPALSRITENGHYPSQALLG